MGEGRVLLCLWLSLGGVGVWGSGGASSRSPSVVLELSDRFLDVKDDGHWFIEFYAPWCGHCKRLAPVWEQMAHILADELPQIRVGKLDATRFSSVASDLAIHGFPTIKYFRNGIVMDYNGDRTKNALVDFAHKAYGPEVRSIYPEVKYFHEKYLQHYKDGYFLIVTDSDNEHSHPIHEEYAQIAKDMFVKTFFYSIKPQGLPENITSPSELPAVLAINSEAVEEFGGDASELREWIECRRFPLMPELTYGNLYDIGLTCNRLLVLIVSDLVKRNTPASPAQQLEELALRTARKFRSDLFGFQFVWLDGNDIANNIVLGTMEIPSILVLNASSQEYALPSDAVSSMTADSLRLWLLSLSTQQWYGGRGFFQRIKRAGYDVYSTIYMMFSTQPLLSVCLFGLPTGILGIICYTLCSVEMTSETEQIYQDSDQDDERRSLSIRPLQIKLQNSTTFAEDHEKRD